MFRENKARVSRVLQFHETAEITKKRVSRNTKIAKTKKTGSKNTKFNNFSFNLVKMPAKVVFVNGKPAYVAIVNSKFN